MPDAPVTDPNSTPWVLLGPVLPGEHPAALPTQSQGTYPQWDAARSMSVGSECSTTVSGYQAEVVDAGAAARPRSAATADTPWQLITSLIAGCSLADHSPFRSAVTAG